MSKIPPELRETATEAIGIERQEVGSWKFGHDGRNVEESVRFGKEDYQKCIVAALMKKNTRTSEDARVNQKASFYAINARGRMLRSDPSLPRGRRAWCNS